VAEGRDMESHQAHHWFIPYGVFDRLIVGMGV